MDPPIPANISEDDYNFLKLDTSDYDQTGSDHLWRPKRLVYLFNLVSAACAGSPGLTVSTWLCLVEGDRTEDIMALWVDGDEELPWGSMDWGPLQYHWKQAQQALRNRWKRVAVSSTPSSPMADRIRLMEDPSVRAAAIAWVILNSRAMQHADAERGLRSPSSFRRKQLIKIWSTFSLSAGSYFAHSDQYQAFDASMSVMGHTCHNDIQEELQSFVPFLCWLEGKYQLPVMNLAPRSCMQCIEIQVVFPRETVINDHPLGTFVIQRRSAISRISFWAPYIIFELTRRELPTLSSWYSSARRDLLEVVECFLATLSMHVNIETLDHMENTLRQAWKTDEDPAYLSWMNGFPNAWRPSLTLLSRDEWHTILDIQDKYFRRGPLSPADLTRLRQLEWVYFVSTNRLLLETRDAMESNGEHKDLEIHAVMSTIVWLVNDYRCSTNLFNDPNSSASFDDSPTSPGALWHGLPEPKSIGSAHRLMLCMDLFGHVCCRLRNVNERELWAYTLRFLQHISDAEVAMLVDIVASGTVTTVGTPMDHSTFNPSRCPVCIKLTADPSVRQPFEGEGIGPLSMRLRELHVRMGHVTDAINKVNNVLNVLDGVCDVSSFMGEYIEDATTNMGAEMSIRLVRTWAIIIILLFERHGFEEPPADELVSDTKNLLNACRDRLMVRAVYGIDLPTGSPSEFMEFLQNLLDDSHDHHDVLDRARKSSYRLGERFRRGMHRLLLKLAGENEITPRAINVRGVRLLGDRRAVTGGGYADIYQGTLGGALVAVKRCRIFGEREKDRLLALVRREALVWRQLRHPFVLPFLGIDLESFDQVSLVSPWMANGNIRDYRGSQALTAQDIHRLLQEVALGLQYLHNQNVVHGDLRGGNILIDADHKVRLADFGLSVLAEATRGAYTSARQTGSVRWLAPELADPHAATWRKTRASDVWAFGCVCLEVCTERSPYAYVPHDALALLAIVAGRAPAERPDALGMSAALWEMCLRCWAPDPAQRLGSGDLVMEMGKVRFWRGWGGSGSDGVGAGR